MTKREQAVVLDALNSITMYVLPVYTFEGHQYVKLDHALQLKEFAREAVDTIAVVAKSPAPSVN